MKISEYIAALETIKAEHGDLEVQTHSGYGRSEARDPKLAYEMVLKGRESSPRFCGEYERDESRRGEKVCRV
jgi:hypothetical protein